MLATYFRNLTGKDRHPDANRHLSFSLAFVAGAVNAGGFLAVKQYTSHMSGIISAIAEDTSLGNVVLVLAGLASLASFILGAACSSILVNWGRRKRLHSQYALPLLLEAFLLLCFGLLGGYLAVWQALTVPATVVLLCFIMGLQNAMITKLSNSEIRTTHMTGVVTDLGIELGKLFYWNSSSAEPRQQKVNANHRKLRILGTMLMMFICGGLVGAVGFKNIGYTVTIPLAVFLIVLAVIPITDDLREWVRQRRND